MLAGPAGALRVSVQTEQGLDEVIAQPLKKAISAEIASSILDGHKEKSIALSSYLASMQGGCVANISTIRSADDIV